MLASAPGGGVCCNASIMTCLKYYIARAMMRPVNFLFDFR
jgi:hypothetical protein